MKLMKAASAVCFAVLLISLAVTGRSHAALVADWSFDQTSYTVGQNDSIELWATFTNDASSTEDLDGGLLSFTSIWGGTVLAPTGPYQLDSSVGHAALLNMYLTPGQTFKWLFGVLSPVNAPVAAGTYWTDGADVTIDERLYGGLGQNAITVTVVADAVPAPAAGLLMMLGLIGIWSMRRKS